jgi:hypothetical protein
VVIRLVPVNGDRCFYASCGQARSRRLIVANGALSALLSPPAGLLLRGQGTACPSPLLFGYRLRCLLWRNGGAGGHWCEGTVTNDEWQVLAPT